MKLWIDDVRPAPEGYKWAQSVMMAQAIIEVAEEENQNIELISIDHDAGDFYHDGGDFICVLNWLEETGRNYPIRIHSMNVVGASNMRAIIEKNGWKELR